MKKPYKEPEWELYLFSFERLLSDGGDDPGDIIINSNPEGTGNDDVEV